MPTDAKGRRKPHPGKDAERARRIVELRKQGLLYKQIAHETGVDGGTVAYHLAKAGLVRSAKKKGTDHA